MKRVSLLALAFVFMMSMACPVFAADLLHNSADKLANGTMEIAKSPLALYDHTKSEMDDADHRLRCKYHICHKMVFPLQVPDPSQTPQQCQMQRTFSGLIGVKDRRGTRNTTVQTTCVFVASFQRDELLV